MSKVICASIKDGETWVAVDVWPAHVEVTVEHFAKKVEFFPTLTEAFDFLESLKDTKRGLSHPSITQLKRDLASYLQSEINNVRKQKTTDYQAAMLFLAQAEIWAVTTTNERMNDDGKGSVD